MGVDPRLLHISKMENHWFIESLLGTFQSFWITVIYLNTQNSSLEARHKGWILLGRLEMGGGEIAIG